MRILSHQVGADGLTICTDAGLLALTPRTNRQSASGSRSRTPSARSRAAPPDAGIAGDQHQLRRAAPATTRSKAASNVSTLARPSRRASRGSRSRSRRVVLARARIPRCCCLLSHSACAPPDIVLSRPGGGLVALLRRLGEQLHDDMSKAGWGSSSSPLARRQGACGRYGSAPTPWESAAVNGSAPVSISVGARPPSV